MLVAGLGTEALIFFFSAFEPPHVEPDWSLVYPELAGMYDGYSNNELDAMMGGEDKKSVVEELDNMLEEAKIGPELIASLGDGLRTLSENSAKMGDITEATVATSEYTQNMKHAATSIEGLSNSYVKTSEVLNESTIKIAKSAESIDFSQIDGTAFNDELNKVAKNLSAINSVYELQLQNSNQQSETFNKVGETMEVFLQNLQQSVDNTSKYKDQADELAKNVAALNNVYGNMLTAMNVNR
jgi:gliding motility-associated protein GldL